MEGSELSSDLDEVDSSRRAFAPAFFSDGSKHGFGISVTHGKYNKPVFADGALGRFQDGEFAFAGPAPRRPESHDSDLAACLSKLLSTRLVGRSENSGFLEFVVCRVPRAVRWRRGNMIGIKRRGELS
jgi:hypothetical protein